MYTDDSHFALLGPQFTVLGLRVWYRIHTSLCLTMAIVEKHAIGLDVKLQGFRLHYGFGIVFIPEDKARRGLSQL